MNYLGIIRKKEMIERMENKRGKEGCLYCEALKVPCYMHRTYGEQGEQQKNEKEEEEVWDEDPGAQGC